MNLRKKPKLDLSIGGRFTVRVSQDCSVHLFRTEGGRMTVAEFKAMRNLLELYRFLRPLTPLFAIIPDEYSDAQRLAKMLGFRPTSFGFGRRKGAKVLCFQ